jgi:predicted transcriptional regulator
MSRMAFASTHYNASPHQSLENGNLEIQTIPDSAIHEKLLHMDISAGHWTEEDPVIEDILSWIRSNFRHLLSLLYE